MQKRIKIIHLTTDSKIGGTEKNILALVKGLDRARFESRVVTLLGGGTLGEEMAKEGVPYHCLNMGCKCDLMGWLGFYKILKNEKPDILHTYLFHANIIGRIVGKRAGVKKIISSERCLDLNRTKFEVWLNRKTIRWTDKITTVSDSVTEMLVKREGFPEEKLVRIYSGIDFIEFEKPQNRAKVREGLGISIDAPLVGCVGRLRPEKGQRYLVQAVPDVLDPSFKGIRKLYPLGLKTFPGAVFLLVGDGVEESRLKALSQKSGVASNVIFAGYRKDTIDIISSLDLLVLPSLEEGLPRVALEAQALGVPVIASKVGGVVEAVRDGKTGILVPPADKDALAGAILQLLADEGLRRSMGEEGKRFVRSKFKLEDTIKETEKLYLELTRESP